MISKLYQLQLDITTTTSIELIPSVSIADFFPFYREIKVNKEAQCNGIKIIY